MANITGIGAPTKSTVGEVGDIYVNSNNGKSYKLIYINTVHSYEGVFFHYNWSEIITDSDPSGGIMAETDPTVPSWAKQPEKPAYTAEEVGAVSKEGLHNNINELLTEAKESGSFDGTTPHIGANGNWFIGNEDTGNPSRGENGKTPEKGVDYFTEADKNEITEQVAESVGIPETLPNPNPLTFTGAVNAVYDGSEEIQIPITDDVQQRQIVKAVDYLFQDEDIGIMQHSFSVEEYPDLKKCKGNLIFIFESFGNTVKTFDGWISARFTLGDVIFNKTLSSTSGTFYTYVSYLFLRNNAYHTESSDNVSKYSLSGNNRAVNVLSIPITELYTIPYDDEANVEIKKLDFEKLTKVDIYGYMETSFTNVKRFKLLVF